MANVRYTSGGSSATLGTKTIDENGIYNAVDDDLDGYSQVTVDVPAPSGAVELSYTANGSYSENIEQYQTAEITVDVPIPTVNTQSKTVTATTSQQTVTPNPGFYLDSVTVNPQQHSATFTPNSDTAANDMGPVNNYRYVNTSGMITPTGTLEVEYTTNGPHTESVRQYDNISIDIDVPVSGDLGTKTITVNGTYNAIDDNLDGYSEVDVNVPQNATLGIKSVTANGNYYAVTDGYDGYSRVDVAVPGAALQSSKSVTATTSQQTVTPDSGYDGLEQVIVDPQVHTQTYTPADDTAANDMGVNNNYRYVDTSGMVTPTSITPSNWSPAEMTTGNAYTPSANALAIEYGKLQQATPSNSSPVSVSGGIAYNIGPTSSASGYLIESYSSITPSNSSPATITSGSIYKASANGKAVSSVTDITPSNSSPVSLSSGTVYKPTASGYAISSYSSKTPSDSSPASVSSGAIIKASASGYLYQSSGLKKVKTGSFTIPSGASNTVTVNCGFQPKYIAYYGGTSVMCIYNSDVSTTKWIRASSSGIQSVDIGGYNYGLNSVTSTGFTVKGGANSMTAYYFAIG